MIDYQYELARIKDQLRESRLRHKPDFKRLYRNVCEVLLIDTIPEKELLLLRHWKYMLQWALQIDNDFISEKVTDEDIEALENALKII